MPLAQQLVPEILLAPNILNDLEIERATLVRSSGIWEEQHCQRARGLVQCNSGGKPSANQRI